MMIFVKSARGFREV